jgi:putative SOS response-associated peptidase YedK
MEKVSFKKLIQTSRCLAIADGYYEWKRENKEKIPYYFTRSDSSLIFFAAIHQNNQFCIITREATDKVKEIHHREPLILNNEQILDYLDIKKEGMDILKSIKAPELKFHVVSKDVNKPINNDPSLIKPTV